MKSKIIIAVSIVAGSLLVATASCKKYADPAPYFEENPDTLLVNSRKVLIIGIDGAVGAEYKTIAPPVLEGLKAHSKYSWDAVSDEVTTDAASWKTMMSGISYSRHQIKDSSFIFSQPAGGAQHTAPAIYPSFFTYLLTSSRADTKTSFISSWGTMLNRLVPEVEDKVVAASDAAVKDSAITRIKKESSDLVVVNFNGVAVAGQADEFSASSAGYKAAVLKVDGYVGELMTALKSRPEYNKKEEWLVIITGTHGGIGNSYGGPSEKESNVFSFYYNENLKEKELTRDGAFAGVELKGRDAEVIRAQALNDGGLYNPGTGQQTIQLRVKGTAGYYPHFFSKMEKWPSTPGWSMFSAGGNWAISVRSTTSGERRIQPGSPVIFDNQWHTITVVFADSASKRWVRRYTDGIRHDQTDITSHYNSGGTIASPSPLTLGWQADPGMPAVTFYSADAMMFNTALTDEEIANGVCLKDISQHPQIANLIGYWPGNDGFGGRLKNKAPGYTTDFILDGGYQWTGIPELPCTIAPNTDPVKESLLVKSVDMVPTIFYWLQVPLNESWDLESTNWLSKYEAEFVKL